MAFKHVYVIVNPAAGKEDHPILEPMTKILGDADIQWEIFKTKEAGDAYRFACDAIKAGVDAVCVNGGDGTVNEVASALADTRMPLAIIPGGTANVMANELGIPGDIEGAFKLLMPDTHAIRTIDMGLVGKNHFTLRCGMGVEASMIQNADSETKAHLGSLAYVISALQALRDPVVAKYQLTLDGQSLEVEGITCIIANSGSIGSGALQIAPNMHVDDGKLDVIVIRSGDIGSLLAVVASVVSGNEKAAPLQHWQAREIHISADPPQAVQVDGEITGNTPVEVKILPHALNVIVPKPVRAAEPIRSDNTLTAPGGLPVLT